MTDIRLFQIPTEPDDVHAVRDDEGDLWVRLTEAQMRHHRGGGDRDNIGRRPQPGAHWFRVSTRAAQREAHGEDVPPGDPGHSEAIISGYGDTWVGLLSAGGTLRDVTGETQFKVADL